MKKPIKIVLISLFLIFLTIMTFGPMTWMVISSFKSQGELMLKPWSMPNQLRVENYVKAWQLGKFTSLFKNSIIITGSSLFFMVFFAAMAAFGICRYKTRFNTKVLLYLLIGQMISATMVIFPLSIILVKIGLQDSYTGLSLVYIAGGLPFSIFVMQSFFRTVPQDLFEAARIDGCSEITTFFMIAVPLVKSAFATVVLYQFMWVWNEFTIAFTLIKSADKRTIPVGLYTIVQGVLQTNYVMAFAGTVIVSVPSILLYLVFQKYLVKGITEGAIKG
jgi:multiple sugar transport system permease protein/raffinose/stachyose/melibiose transport system permease protein/N-acetylglucosamine transport system permease protein